jgi:hypothetical protein
MQDKSNTSLQQTLLKNETLPSHPFATSNFAARSQRFIQFKEKRPLIWILIEFIYRRVETTFDNKFNRSPNKNKEMIDLTYAYVQLCTHRPNHYQQGDVISSEQENSKRNQSNQQHNPQQAARLKSTVNQQIVFTNEEPHTITMCVRAIARWYLNYNKSKQPIQLVQGTNTERIYTRTRHKRNLPDENKSTIPSLPVQISAHYSLSFRFWQLRN